MNKSQHFSITCDGIKLHCKLDLPETGGAPGSSSSGSGASGAVTDAGAPARIPLVIVVPGLSGDMEESQITASAEALSANGYASLCVELYGHGLSEGPFFDLVHIPDETKVFDDDRISGNYYRVNRLLPLDDAIALYGDRPVLVVHSTTDEYVPYHYAVRTAGAYRNAELFTVPDDDHCFTAHMDLVAAKMIGFLDRLEGRSGQEQDLCR